MKNKVKITKGKKQQENAKGLRRERLNWIRIKRPKNVLK